MKILGIESSCDDTSIALLDCSSKGFFVIKESTISQIDIHKKYGGVVPELAGRMHAEKITPLIETVLDEHKQPDMIAVSSGPGLITGLLVGVEAAKTLSYLLKKPLVSVNHMEGHIYSVELAEQKITYPALALLASGGHTELILIKQAGQYERLGATLDDAAGEAFDKIAKLLGLPYPGGPQISAKATKGNPQAIKLPRPMLHNKNFDFSFSGLKTAALYYWQKNPNTNINDFCASTQQAIIDVLVSKTVKATKKHKPKTVILAGGVSANIELRKTLQKELKATAPDSQLLVPQTKYSMDNAAMIAVAGYYKAKNNHFTDWSKIQADPNWKIYATK